MPGEQPPANPPIEGDVPVTPEPAPKSKRGLLIGLAIVVVVFLLAVAGPAIVVAISNAGSTNFAVNSCVKQDGDGAKSADCSDAGSFRIVSKVEKPESCSDASQPYIVLEKKGQKEQVLCLRPASQK